jgi:predicted Zn-dependent peptidase
MKLRLLLAAFATATTLATQAQAYQYDTVPGDPTHTRIYTLNNGLRVYLSVNTEKPRIQTYIAVRTGSKNDPAETTGLAHYLEHLMFKGTSRFGVTNPEAEAPLLAEIEQRYEQYRRMTDPEARRQAYHEIDSVSQVAAQYFIPNEYDKLMAIIGSDGSNAYTSNDVTCYVEDIPANEVDNWARIQADRFQNMVIRGFHTELEAVYEEYNIGIAQDRRKLWEAIGALLYPTHPYGTQTTIGTQEHLKNPSITNIKEYFNHWYRPNNVAICMAGDMQPDQVIAIIDRHFGQWQPGADVTQPTFAPLAPITQPRDTTVMGLEAETLWMGWRFGQGNSLQQDTLNIISDMLSNGTAGLIDLDINQQMKMLSAWAGSDVMHDYSTFIMAGTPKEGQTLDEVRQLLLEEIDKLCRGDFSDDLLPSVINNTKLNFYTALESNRSRADMFVDAFINEIPWSQQVNYLERISNITKQQVVDFARRHLRNDNYVAVYKRQGEDTTQKKIDKPQITPIPTNRDLVSQFVTEIQQTQVQPIQPRFVDFQRDLTFSQTKKNIPVVYVQNTENGRFTLSFQYKFGEEADLRYYYAADYLEYLGTSRYTNEEIQQQFYKLACSYNISVGARNIYVTLSGLGENMPQALALLEHLLKDARVDQEAWLEDVALIEKSRADAKLDQQSNFTRLTQYGNYGPYNTYRNIMTAQQLQQQDPQELLNLLKDLSKYEHTILYYGPMTVSELSSAITKNHKTGRRFQPVPQGRHYTMQATPQNEILIAPYDAKNIYMRMVHNELRPWQPEEAAVKALFNEYYGGGMNTIVFQELREARGLAYSAFAAYIEPSYQDQPEYFFTHIVTQNDKMMDCIRQFHQILDTIPQSQMAFDIAREALTKRLSTDRYTKFGLINAWLSAQELGIDYDIDERIYQQLPSITLADIVNFEQQQMARKPYRYIILGNEEELDMNALQQLGPIRRVTTEEIFGY